MAQPSAADPSSRSESAGKQSPDAGLWFVVAAAEGAARACSEDRLNELVDDQVAKQLSRQHSELELAESELEAVYAISGSAGRTCDRNELLSNILDVISEVEGLRDYAEQAILAADGEFLRVVSSRAGFTCPAIQPDRPGVRVGECLCGLAVEKAEIVTSPTSSTDARYSAPTGASESCSHVVVPLRSMGRTLGALHLHQPVGVEPDARRLKLLSSVGERIGAAMEMARLSEETRELSLFDPLTGLANRRLMRIALEENAARARRRKCPFSVVMLDLDHFRKYNDSHGRAAGDKLLVDVATLIMKQIREMDLAVRYGGEEFLILLPETGLDDAVRVAERVRTSVMETDFFHDAAGSPAHITVSPGVASCGQGAEGEFHVVDMAEKAMLHAKRTGRNRVESWPLA